MHHIRNCLTLHVADVKRKRKHLHKIRTTIKKSVYAQFKKIKLFNQ